MAQFPSVVTLRPSLDVAISRGGPCPHAHTAVPWKLGLGISLYWQHTFAFYSLHTHPPPPLEQFVCVRVCVAPRSPIRIGIRKKALSLSLSLSLSQAVFCAFLPNLNCEGRHTHTHTLLVEWGGETCLDRGRGRETNSVAWERDHRFVMKTDKITARSNWVSRFLLCIPPLFRQWNRSSESGASSIVVVMTMLGVGGIFLTCSSSVAPKKQQFNNTLDVNNDNALYRCHGDFIPKRTSLQYVVPFSCPPPSGIFVPPWDTTAHFSMDGVIQFHTTWARGDRRF